MVLSCVLNYDTLDNIPPIFGVIEMNVLSLFKIVESLGGYFSVTLSNKWGIIAKLQGLTNEDSEAVRNCYKKFIDLILIYHDTTRVPQGEKPLEVGESSKLVEARDPQGQKGSAERDGTHEEEMNKFGVKLDDNEDGQQGSSQDSNDFEVIA